MLMAKYGHFFVGEWLVLQEPSQDTCDLAVWQPLGCVAISKAPFSSRFVLQLVLRRVRSCRGTSEEVTLSPQLCMGQTQGPGPCLLVPELIVLHQQEGGLRLAGFFNIHWFN